VGSDKIVLNPKRFNHSEFEKWSREVRIFYISGSALLFIPLKVGSLRSAGQIAIKPQEANQL